jgi:hypothetical protein
MKNRNPLRALSLGIGLATMLLGGCQPARQAGPVRGNANPDTAGVAAAVQDGSRQVADAALGKQAEILARGDLARNGLDQVLVVNEFARPKGNDSSPKDSEAVFVTRAAILQEGAGKWTELLRCDEHLKNQNGYLGGSPTGRITGWRLEFRTDTKQGLELKFTPAESESGEEGSGMGAPGGQTVVVRWNARTKSYQSLDSTHEKFLSEAPMLETPQSILK